MSATELHSGLCAFYGQNIKSEGTSREWRRKFKDGRRNVHDEGRSGRQSAASGDLVQSADQNICERRRFTISELSCEFPQISRIVLYEIITVRLICHKLCARWVSKMITGAHKTQKMALALTFFTAIPQRWR
jgi:hypothetical protein